MHDTDHTDFPTCPRCGGIERAVDDLDLRHDDDSAEFACGVCGHEIRVTVHISCTHSTRLVEEEES